MSNFRPRDDTTLASVNDEVTPARRVLVVDDEATMGDLLVQGLAPLGFEVESATDGTRALEMITAAPCDAVGTDLRMRGMTGLELCTRIRANHPDVPVLILSAFGDLDAAVDAMRAGAYDFLSKPIDVDALALALRRATTQHQLTRRVRSLEATLAAATGFGDFVGSSPAMRQVYNLLDQIASSNTSVLITGASGTGKELVARFLHRRSSRSEGPFVVINCAAMPESLLESELFGHEKGAFTDAIAQRDGLFVKATGGTLFLDEIGELPLGLQAKLLRAFQERTIRHVGGGKEIRFDVRLVTATNRNLEAAVEEKRFREDLFFRINVIEVPLPPLRMRGNDILLLAQHFLQIFAKRADKTVAGLAPETASHLLSYPWPGNVRELQNIMERAVALTASEQIQPADLPAKLRETRRTQTSAADTSELVSLEENERRYILQVLEATSYSTTAAARTLRIDRTTLLRKLERYRIVMSGPEKA